jgi:hypothetical protein
MYLTIEVVLFRLVFLSFAVLISVPVFAIMCKKSSVKRAVFPVGYFPEVVASFRPSGVRCVKSLGQCVFLLKNSL